MKKKKFNLFKGIIALLFFSYLIIFICANTGYYEYKNHKKVSLTEEQIKKFETDINNGVEIDINNYVIKDDYKYDNKLSLACIKLSNFISKVVSNSIESSFKYLSKYIYN